MGMDFRTRVNKSLRKGWDRGVDVLCGVDLFTGVPTWLKERVLFRQVDGANLQPGDQLIIRVDSDCVCAFVGFDRVAVAENQDFLSPALSVCPGNAAHGIVDGTFELSGLAEVSVQVPV